MLNLNHLPPYYGPRMQTRMLERSQKYAWRGTSLDIRTYGRALSAYGRALTITRAKLVILYPSISQSIYTYFTHNTQRVINTVKPKLLSVF